MGGRCVMAAKERMMEFAVASGTTLTTNLASVMSIQISCWRSVQSTARICRQGHDKAGAPPALRRAARVAAVPSCDLPHQRKPQSRAGDVLGSRAAVERVEHALALGLGNARAVVADGQFRAASGAGEAYLNRRSAVAFCIFQQ